MISQTKKQTIATHILPNISRSKDNQIMKFGQLVEYKNAEDKLFSDPFLESQTSAYLWINSLKFFTVFLNFIPSWGLSKYIETKLQTTCFHLILNYSRNKRGLELVSLSRFLHDFWRKIFPWLYSINWPNFIVKLLLLSEILGNMCIVTVCQPSCDTINFEINLYF